jgi:hypothetical protein
VKYQFISLIFLALSNCSWHDGHVLMQEIELGNDRGTLSVFWNYRERSCSWLECGESSTRITNEELRFEIENSNLGINKSRSFACSKKYPCQLKNLKIAICDNGILFLSYADEALERMLCHGDLRIVDFSKNYGDN